MHHKSHFLRFKKWNCKIIKIVFIFGFGNMRMFFYPVQNFKNIARHNIPVSVIYQDTACLNNYTFVFHKTSPIYQLSSKDLHSWI